MRRRLLYIAVSVGVGSAAAYGFEHQIIEILLKPSDGQHFIYTSPMGGMNFLFTVCLDIGLIVATPLIVYQLLAFVQPLMKDTTHRFLLWASGASGAVALFGVVFGYFVGLPSALHFLLHQFTTMQVKPLITIQSYMQFVALYLLGYALMFQLPLIVLLINRIKPLGPRTLLKYERHMIAGAVIVAFIMNPSPNLIDQAFVVVPIIISYQLSILMLWYLKRRGRPAHLQQLRDQDSARQAERTGRELKPLDAPLLELEPALVALPEDYAQQAPAIPELASVSAAEAELEEQASAAVAVHSIASPHAPTPQTSKHTLIAIHDDTQAIQARTNTAGPTEQSTNPATATPAAHRVPQTAAKIQITSAPATPTPKPEPTPITYTPDPDVEHINVRVVRPRPITLERRNFIPSLRSQLIQ